jgi:pimeloyl-ACP methyl ester carboxylesterase
MVFRRRGSVLLALGVGTAIVAVVLAVAAPAKGNLGDHGDFAGLVDIGGGRQIYMECHGTGSPTIVFVSGGGDRTETWSKTLDPKEQAVLPAIAETNRVCTYDRPGTILATGEGLEDFEKSRSDPVPQPTTLQDGVDDLHALLGASGERGPYVVVGHSLGGAIAKLYASEYPQNVSGLVLIDYLPYQARNALNNKQWRYWKDQLLGPPPEEALDLYPAFEQNANQQNFYQDSAAAPLKPMPFIVLSADEPYDLKSMVEAGQIPADVGGGVSAEEFGKILFNAVVDARADLVSRVPGARHITNTDSGHYIHQEHPKLVTNSIREVVDVAVVGGTTLGDTGGPPMVPAGTLAAALALVISSLAVMRFVLRRNASS